MNILKLTDRELIEKHGGGYGRTGIVHETREYRRLPEHANVPSAFLAAAKRRGLNPGDNVYVLLLSAVARELGSDRASAPKKAVPGITYVFKGEPQRRHTGPVRYLVKEAHGVEVTFGLDPKGDVVHIATVPHASASLVQAAKEYTQEHWSRKQGT